MAQANRPWFGPEYREQGWVPAPRYLMRRARALSHLRKLPKGRVLEIGAASGALLSELSAEGFHCTGLETSPGALALARNVNGDIEFSPQPSSEWSDSFDYCLAFEVLEHIESDVQALKEWSAWLRPGGRILLSVPAHQRLWNGRDVWAGHYRRYSGADLRQVCSDSGLAVEKVECYGFPFANILENIIALKYRRFMRDGATVDDGKRDAQTAESGIDRSLDVKMFPYYARFPGSLVMRAMIWLQSLFLGTNIGNGYIVIARKPEVTGLS